MTIPSGYVYKYCGTSKHLHVPWNTGADGYVMNLTLLACMANFVPLHIDLDPNQETTRAHFDIIVDAFQA
jgi:hypothetical protein